MHSYNVQPTFCNISYLSLRFASRHILKYHGEASDWLVGARNLLARIKSSLLLIQTVEGRKCYVRLKSSKVGDGRCNLDKQGI